MLGAVEKTTGEEVEGICHTNVFALLNVSAPEREKIGRPSA